MYSQLLEFIQNKMRMSHIYQPVMLMTLLENGGRCSVRDISKQFLTHDESQLEYYDQITKGMPGRVLGQHGLIHRDKDQYELLGASGLSDSEIQSLLEACQERLDAFLDQRGSQAFQHRKKSAGYVSGTLRYEVLKAAKYRCELCGISAEQKALEVDHILPRNQGGSDDLSNLQALCYSCNAMKRDRDDTDFRGVKYLYDTKDDQCIFCALPADRIVAENELAVAIRDGYPVTDLHTLAIPKRHVSSYFDLSRPEVNACNQLLQEQRQQISKQDAAVAGFNVGINVEEAAGQTVMHCHIHLIPRRKGDMENPRGGVRGVIPRKQKY